MAWAVPAMTRFLPAPKQFLRYASVGAVATAVHYAMLVLAVEAFGWPAFMASGFGAVVGAQPGGQLDPVELGHSNVGDDKVRDAIAYVLERLDPVAGLAHHIASPLQETTNHLLDHAIVVDQDDVLFSHHRTPAVSLYAMAVARSRRV